MTRIVIAGSRDYNDYEKMETSWNNYLKREELKPEDVIIITGGAKGADTQAKKLAKEQGIKHRQYLPNWHEYGKKAGPIRNAEMIKNADRLIAFWDEKSRGTANTIQLAKRKGIPTLIIKTTEEYAEAEQLTLW